MLRFLNDNAGSLAIILLLTACTTVWTFVDDANAQDVQVEKPLGRSASVEMLSPDWESFRGPRGRHWKRTWTGEGWIIYPGSYGAKYYRHPPFYVPDKDKKFLKGARRW
jgi:hypothetical protein